MIGTFERGVRPIVILDQDSIIACFTLVNKAREETWDAKEKKQTSLAPKISIEMRNGDTYQTRSIDKLIQFENKSRNPVKEVRIQKGSYGSNYIELKLGGDWLSSEGAHIKIHGEKEFSDEVIGEFDRIIKKDKPISEIIPSIHPFILALLIASSIYYFVFGLDRIIVKFHELSFLRFSFLAIFLLVSLGFFVSMFVDAMQSRFFGRFVLYWSDGQTRYDKARTIANYVFWILPTTIVLKHIGVF
jgi:hypothetical protein